MKKKSMLVPVGTVSPICSSDIITDFPFSRVTLAVDGKHESSKQKILLSFSFY